LRNVSAKNFAGQLALLEIDELSAIARILRVILPKGLWPV